MAEDENPWDNSENFTLIKGIPNIAPELCIWKNNETNYIYKVKGQEYDLVLKAYSANLTPRVIRDGISSDGLEYFVSEYGGINLLEKLKNIVKPADYKITEENKVAIKELFGKVNDLRKTIIEKKKNGEIPCIHGDFKATNIVYNETTGELLTIDWDPLGMKLSEPMEDRFKSDLHFVHIETRKRTVDDHIEASKRTAALQEIWTEVIHKDPGEGVRGGAKKKRKKSKRKKTKKKKSKRKKTKNKNSKRKKTKNKRKSKRRNK